MNRLTDIYNGTLHSQIVYDPLGRMTDKQADGQVVFGNANFAALQGQATRPHAMKSAETVEGVFPPARQQVTYTGFDKVKSILEDGNGLIITYGYNQQRIQSYLMTSDNRYLNKDYVGVCEYNTEYFTDGSASQTTLTYLVGPYGVFAVVENYNNTISTHYILKDHLGSWTTITDSEGHVEQEVSFDAWGTLRDPDTWQNYSVAEPVETPMFDRGFTGHEHLYAFGLINMNGRLYDPLTSSFLSVDAYVQSPEDAQSFNRYAYCHNNPLRYVDPSGWYMLGAGYGTSFNNNPGWGESYSQHAYEPRELGMLQLPDCSVMTWWMEGERLGGGGGGGGCSTYENNASKFYDDQGRCLGSINNGDGKVYVLRAENADVLKKRKDIKRFLKGKSSSINADEIYLYFIEIEPSKENRQRMYEIVSADDGTGGTSPKNNREYGGYIKDGVVIPVNPGPVGDPRDPLMLSIEIPFGYSSFHSHASGYIIERNRTDVRDAWWTQTVHQKTLIMPVTRYIMCLADGINVFIFMTKEEHKQYLEKKPF